MCKALGQSLLQPDQYRSSIKSPVLLYSLSYNNSALTVNSTQHSQLLQSETNKQLDNYKSTIRNDCKMYHNL